MKDLSIVDSLKKFKVKIDEKHNPWRTLRIAIIISFFVFLIDYFNFPSSMIAKHGAKLFIVAFILFVLCVLISCLQYNLIAVLKMYTITWLDNFIIFCIYFSAIYLVLVFFTHTINGYKTSLVIVLVSGVGLLAYRFLHFKHMMLVPTDCISVLTELPVRL